MRQLSLYNVTLARSFALFLRRFDYRRFGHRLIALCLIALLVAPLLFVKTEARALATATTRLPTPFLINSVAEPEDSVFSKAARLSTTISSFVLGRKPPAGLEASGVTTPFDLMYERVTSLLGFSSADSRTATLTLKSAGVVDFDFDNDGKADIGRWHKENREFKVKNTNGGSFSTFTLGSTASVVAPGDYNGDNQTDAAVFENGVWTYKTSPTANPVSFSWGMAGDIPVPGDYDGDNITDPTIYRPSDNTWWVLRSTGGHVGAAFGITEDIATPGDYDGDGKNDLAIFRPSTGVWHILGTMNGYYTRSWGLAIDTPVPADYDGDGKTDPAVFRPSEGVWYAYRSGLNNGSYYAQSWGLFGDQPVPADYDGDSRADFAVWRPSSGVWYTIKSADSSIHTETFGVPGDTPIPAAYVRKVDGGVSRDELINTRLRPNNAIGETNYYSQNFSWGTTLVGLPGRADLDVGLEISYNSLVWTKVGSAIVFDADNSNASPGFRFGPPVIEPVHWNSERNAWAYLMITSSGARRVFVRVGNTNTFETVDSSYTQLVTTGASEPNDPVEGIELSVRSTDGTVMSYVWHTGAYRCNEIKDRNGNYLSFAYDGLGYLQGVTDTLGRVLNVSYDSTTYLPIAITQQWKANNGAGPGTVMHTWATFSYGTKAVETDFAGLTVVGPPNGTAVTVLDRITYPDGGSTKFEYNEYLQIEKISSVAADSQTHVLNYVTTNLSDLPPQQPDCPRFTQTRTWVENFNDGQETIATNTVAHGHTPSDIDGNPVTASLIQVAIQNHPNGNITNTYVGSSGWMEGLPIRVDDYSNGNGLELKRSALTRWTQDVVGTGTQVNPRITESLVTDGITAKRSITEYYPQSPGSSISLFGLVKRTEVANGSEVLKRVDTEYNLDNAYVSRRIIGLPAQVNAWGKNDDSGSLEFVSSVTFNYDEGGFTQEPNQIISPLNHDTDGFGSAFVVGRGNLTSITRHDVANQTPSVSTAFRYDIAGSQVASLDALGRKVAVSYTDQFNDDQNGGTFAYPTAFTDSTGNTSTVKYRHDIGANVRAQSPAPAGSTIGRITERIYDTIGRLLRETSVNTGAYTRYAYPSNGVTHQVYSTQVDTNGNNTGDAADEVLTESWTDGAGRVVWTRSEHPNSTGGWIGTVSAYDVLGRIKSRSVPTEIAVPNPNDPGTWVAAGNDATRGFLWTHQKYDWMNRVVRKINTDGNDSATLNASDVLISYDGCGCAGGLITTIQGELVPRDDEPAVYARPVHKRYSDILGRMWKSEQYTWNGAVYSATTSRFNGRDQTTSVRRYEGPADGSNVFQESVMTYDGHGRLKTKHVPEQDGAASMTYGYYADDRLATTTDGRGTTTTNSYDSRGLLEQVVHSAPSGSTLPTTGATTFTYDATGNRSQMVDQTGTKNYFYDSISRLTSETKQFNGQNNSPTGTFTISYTYHLGGELKSVTEPFGQRIDYAVDRIGRLSQVTGTPIGDPYPPTPSYYLNNIQYLAFGAVKSLSYGSGATMNQQFNNRLQVAEHKVKTVPWWATTPPWNNFHAIRLQYTYRPDGKVSYIKDLDLLHDPPYDSQWDRGYRYDQVGRITLGLTGREARGETEPYLQQRPYRQTFAYDTWGNVTSSDTWEWDVRENRQHTYVNNRESTWEYDADGRLLASERPLPNFTETSGYTYDVAGLLVTNVNLSAPHCEVPATTRTTQFWIDGDGQTVKRRVTASNSIHSSLVEYEKFFIRSSVLSNQVIADVNPGGSKSRTYIYAYGTVLAMQTYASKPVWEHRDPSNIIFTTSFRDDYEGTEAGGGAVLDPAGSAVGSYESEPCGGNLVVGDGDWGYPGFGLPYRRACYLDFAEVQCGFAMRFLGNMGALAPEQTSRQVTFNGEKVWAHFKVMADGYLGYLPTNASYLGGGRIEPSGPQKVSNYQLSLERQAIGRLNGIRNPVDSGEFRQVLPDKQGACDFRISGIFGDEDSLAATAIEPGTLREDGRVRNRIGLRGEDPRQGVMHQFANQTGTPESKQPGFTGNLYTPTGYSSLVGKADDYYLREKGKRPYLQTTYSNIQVRYAAGSLSRYGYSGSLVISFIHAGPINSPNRKPSPIRNGPIRDNNTQLIGTIGADGSPYDGGGGGGLKALSYYGSKRPEDTEDLPVVPKSYVHNHVIFYRGNMTPIDPRTVFCSDLGF